MAERSYMVRPEAWDPFAVRAEQREDRNERILFDREFIIPDPPCELGDRRFIASFGVDQHKRLVVSIKDLKDGNRSHIQLSNGERVPLPVKRFPVVKL